jgi:hypothetical protein
MVHMPEKCNVWIVLVIKYMVQIIFIGDLHKISLVQYMNRMLQYNIILFIDKSDINCLILYSYKQNVNCNVYNLAESPILSP